MPVRWGIVGCGEVATKKVAPSFKQIAGTQLVAVTAMHRVRAEAFARQFEIEKVYNTLEELLTDPEIDAVYLATPPNLHYPQTLAAAQAGKHVLCEKPMALKVGQCREMIAACQQAGVRLMVAYYRRFWPQVLRMRQLIEDGELGEIVNARIQLTGNVMFEPETVRRWKLRPELSGGGVWMDVGGHRIDLLFHLIGEVLEVASFTEHDWEYQVDNSSNVLMRFSNGALAMASFNWSVNYVTDDFEIIGTKAKILASPLGGEKLYLQRHREKKEIATPLTSYAHAGLIAHTVESIEKGVAHAISGEVGLKISRVIEAAYLSSRERRTISLEEIRQ